MKVQAIIPAAGSGLRMRSRTPKLFLKLNGVPVLVRTCKALEQSRQVKSVIIATARSLIKPINILIKRYRLKKVLHVIEGGATRQASVARGLKMLDADTSHVCVHDGARPFVSAQLIDQVIKAAKNIDGAIAALPVKSTIKKVDGRKRVVKTLRRNRIWEVQTPQVFKAAVLKKAHARVKNNQATDDAMLVEQLGKTVKIVEGDERNIKITTPQDLLLAKVLL